AVHVDDAAAAIAVTIAVVGLAAAPTIGHDDRIAGAGVIAARVAAQRAAREAAEVGAGRVAEIAPIALFAALGSVVAALGLDAGRDVGRVEEITVAARDAVRARLARGVGGAVDVDDATAAVAVPVAVPIRIA